MSDLISKKEAIDKINERQRELIYCFGFENDMVKIMDIARSIIIAMPSAQPEIIRCKDCKFFELSKDELASQYKISGCFRLKKQSAEYPLLTDGNGFCSWAERRTDGSD